MPDMTFDEAIARIYKWIPVSVSEKIENTLRDRVAELERVNGISIEEIHILQNQSTSKSEKVAELEKMVPKSIETIKRGEAVSLVSTADYNQTKSDNAAMRALLKECEWLGPQDLEHIPTCVICKRAPIQGHAPGCEWGKFAVENNKL